MKRDYFVTDKYSIATKEREWQEEEDRRNKKIAYERTRVLIRSLVAQGATVTAWKQNDDGTKEPAEVRYMTWRPA